MTDAGFFNRVVLVTGGTGSFGHTAVRMFLDAGCAEVRVFSRDELKQAEMRERFSDDRIRFYLGDVRDRYGMDDALRGVDDVLHAAALKQVPSCEFFPMQAVLTNILGTQHVIDAALRAGVSRMVCLSTDKAAYPINAMGMTKALSEKVAHAAMRKPGVSTVVSVVRYGNVLYSRGSVLPVFVDQVRAGRPMTITDPAMTRFVLSLPEAITLVLFALQHARPGDLFIRKAPACTVGDLATAAARVLGVTTPPVHIGTRHAEKLFETLATREELSRAEDMGDYYRISMDDRHLNYAKYVNEGTDARTVLEDYTSHNAPRLDAVKVAGVLHTLPEMVEAIRGLGQQTVARV